MEGCEQGCSYKKAMFGTVSKQVWKKWLIKDNTEKIV